VRYPHRFYNFILFKWHLYAAIAAVAVNAGVQANHIVSQRAILLLNPEQANRGNCLYVAIFFVGGAIGSPIMRERLAAFFRFL
jgi:hypothetical protein